MGLPSDVGSNALHDAGSSAGKEPSHLSSEEHWEVVYNQEEISPHQVPAGNIGQQVGSSAADDKTRNHRTKKQSTAAR